MQNVLLHARRIGTIALFLCVLSGSSTLLFSQARDFNAERFLLDDDAGDGTRNTLTLQVPVPGLSADRILTFPDASGTVMMIMIGSIKLSNCAARIKKINPIARKNANPILLELSW